MTSTYPLVRLGRSNLEVVPIGLAASYGASGPDVERAFERGMDFFYWGSYRSPSFAEGLRALSRTNREKIKVVVQTYARSAKSMESSLDKALRALSFDYIDVLLLGWWNLPPQDAILDAAADLRARGRARHVMVSCHHRPTFKHLAKDKRIDLLMLRYNAAHPGAERDVFPHLEDERPGIVTYTSTCWGQLLDPKNTPPNERTPTAADCYRFALSNPNVDACWAGAKGKEQIDDALSALEKGKMSEEELAWMRRVGENAKKNGGLQERGTNLADRMINLVSGFGFRRTRDLPAD